MTATTDLPQVSRQALADAVPLFLPAIPFALVVGVAIRQSVIPAGAGMFSSPALMAGAAQLALLTLAGTASIWAVMSAVIVINARHIMYSAALSPAFKDQPRWFRWFGPFFLLDQVFALTAPHSADSPAQFRRYYLVVSAVFFTGWHVSLAAGLAVGSVVPAAWQLGYAPAVMFVGLVVFGLDRRPAVVAAVVGATASFLAIGLPNRAGLLVGALCGVVAGFLADRTGNDAK